MNGIRKPKWLLKMNLTIIAAISDLYGRRIIGKEGKIPWNIPEDLIRFKYLTSGKAVIYGRITAENIYSRLNTLLPNRYNFLVSESLREDCEIIQNSRRRGVFVGLSKKLDDAINNAFYYSDEIYIAGGFKIYEEALKRRDLKRLEITEIKKIYEGDVFFPEINWKEWNLIRKIEKKEINFLSFSK